MSKMLNKWSTGIVSLSLCMGFVFSSISLLARNNPLLKERRGNTTVKLRFAENCNNAVAQIDQAINNVRARLTTGGDVWWDSNDGRYIVPKVPAGLPEVSSIFAGAVWLGGVDPAGNLKIAAQTYGRSSGDFDFWPGPLNPETGKTNQTICSRWDRFFTVKGESIREHIRKFQQAQKSGKAYDPDDIPRDIKGWPARGNEFFFEIHNFELPNTSQGLAAFWDQDGDGLFNPDRGDFPVIEIRGCVSKPQFPDEMIFWVYNDAGNIHSESRGDPIQMEVQVQAFSYATNDEINDMTFQRYKLINRAVESIDSTFFAMWVDADLGCFTDDYVGSDVSRSLGYMYNEDALDGQTGCACPQGVNTYCDEVPILGVDYFRGPLDENGEEIGMSSFTYYNNGGVGSPAPGTTDPATAQEYYNYLSGSWRDGSPFTFGDDAYQDGAKVKYAFSDAPNNSRGWSMCTANLPFGDRRTIQASGPFRLDPGAVNELIIGVVWVADQTYPCPDISKLLEADDIAQALFDNCFEITDGPDAPDIDFIELDREIIAVFTNDSVTSNNAFEGYAQRGLQIPAGAKDSLYKFEGYKLYQLANSSVTVADLENPDKSRLIYQVDLKNEVNRIFNWKTVDNPTGEEYYVPELKVEGGNNGIQHTFRIKEDQFSEGDRRLINHKKYYFVAVAYAHNNYRVFDPKAVLGQRKPYLEGRRNIGDGRNPFYTVLPHPTTDKILNAAYGEGTVITRISGAGTGENFLDISADTRTAMLGTSFSGQITYLPGRAPIQVKIFNPLEVKDGQFELKFKDKNETNGILETPVTWELRNLRDPNSPVIKSERPIEELNEQIIRAFGFSITIGQVSEPGSLKDAKNGAIGIEVTYKDKNGPQWLGAINDGFSAGSTNFDATVFDFISTGDGQVDAVLDPTQALSKMGGGQFSPYFLADWRVKGERDPAYISPAISDNSASSILRTRMKLADLNNVDIVFTKDKNLWSKCVVIESANRFYRTQGFNTEGNRRHFDLRARPGVTKEDTNGDGLPDPNTADLTEGLGWFPGYAIDVETGRRLNIFFGENSVYNGTVLANYKLGADMMFNPDNLVRLSGVSNGNLGFYPVGGQHFVYVTKQTYDECKAIRNSLRNAAPVAKILALQEITWSGLIYNQTTTPFLSYKDGLIPNDAVVKIRVNNSYSIAGNENNGHPVYRFQFDKKEAEKRDAKNYNVALDAINVVPNPYYGFSDYEVSQFTTTIKFTNLPANCTVTIYSLDGKFIRQYKRDEVGAVPRGNNRAITTNQITPDLEWDLKNNRGIPVASGVYLMHIDAGELGSKTIKWFGINRKFDPSGL